MKVQLPASDLTEAYRMMLRIRFFEERVRQLRTTEHIVGSVHLCIGQEAIYAGARHALQDADPVFATYRGHGWAIASGVPLDIIFGELMGRANGVNVGRGGSAYFMAPEWGFYGENSIVGGGVPIAVGAALGFTFQNRPQVALAAIGDGAMNQGATHEALNFASAFDLPVVFVVENNLYSELTPTREMVNVDSLATRSDGYGIPGTQVDGNDFEAVRSAVVAAAERARQGSGPSLIVCDTQRLVGHYIGDMELYRPRGEVEEASKTEPLVQLSDTLASRGIDPATLETIDEEVATEVEAACQTALNQPLSSDENAIGGIYA